MFAFRLGQVGKVQRKLLRKWVMGFSNKIIFWCLLRKNCQLDRKWYFLLHFHSIANIEKLRKKKKKWKETIVIISILVGQIVKQTNYVNRRQEGCKDGIFSHKIYALYLVNVLLALSWSFSLRESLHADQACVKKLVYLINCFAH